MGSGLDPQGEALFAGNVGRRGRKAASRALSRFLLPFALAPALMGLLLATPRHPQSAA